MIAPRCVIRRDRALQLPAPEEALTLVQLLPNVLRRFHGLAAQHEGVCRWIVFPDLIVRLMRYATVEHADKRQYDHNVVALAGGDEAIVTRRPLPVRERHREYAPEGFRPAHPAEHVDADHARAAIVDPPDDRLLHAIPGHVES